MRFVRFQVLALLVGFLWLGGCRSAGPRAGGPAGEGSVDVAFLDTLQHRTFNYFWETTNPANGLTPDRAPRRTFSSVAAVGFALTAYPIGIERGFVSRDEAVERVLTTLDFLWEAPQNPEPTEVTGYRGFFYHFLDQDTGYRYRDVELSSIDTALLMAGVLFCQSYFDGDDPAEVRIRALADSLYLRVEWDWIQPRAPLISMAWDPDLGYLAHDYTGYNEAMILYLLALGSPTYPISMEAWDVYSSSYTWGEFYGFEHVNFTPLFGHQYSHAWVDFRGIQDDYMREKGIDYFENSRRATYSQRAYAIDNPGGWVGYGENLWGLTASDGPASVTKAVNGTERQFHTYWARGASLEHINDDGTIAPTAAGGSVPFAPEITLPALQTMRTRFGDALFSTYGFLDAFNPSFTFTDVTLQHGQVVPGLGWFDTDYLGIGQGPILIMVENYRSGLVWETMKRNPYLARGLQRAGFTGGWLEDQPAFAADVTVRDWDALQEADREDVTPVVILGSSTAAGTGPDEASNAWVNRLRAYARTVDPSIRIFNFARGGYTTYHLLPTGTAPSTDRPNPDERRNITHALARRPAAIIINLPSNDTARGFTVDEQLRNFELLSDAAEAAGIPVWITTTQPRNLSDDQRRELAALRDAILKRYGDRAIDFWTGIARPDATIDPAFDSGDHVHLNDEAHRLLFERVRAASVLESVLAEAGLAK